MNKDVEEAKVGWRPSQQASASGAASLQHPLTEVPALRIPTTLCRTVFKERILESLKHSRVVATFMPVIYEPETELCMKPKCDASITDRSITSSKEPG